MSERLAVCAVEHAETVGVMMAKELSSNDGMVLLYQIQVLLVELWGEPGFTSFFLKETWGNMANDVHLGKRITSELA